MKRIHLEAATIVFALTAFPMVAEARFARDAGANAPMVELVACRVIRERIVRPNGRIIDRTVRRCTPDPRVCSVRRERVFGANGRIIYRSVRVCR